MNQQGIKLAFISFSHVDDQGVPDFWGSLSVEFMQEDDQWVGVCRELGTVAHADTLDQVQEELNEAIGLQLNEMERISDVREYLNQNQVEVEPIPSPLGAGFAVAGTLGIL